MKSSPVLYFVLALIVLWVVTPAQAQIEDDFGRPADSIGQLDAFESAEEINQKRVRENLESFGLNNPPPLQENSTTENEKATFAPRPQPIVTDPPEIEPPKTRRILRQTPRVNGFSGDHLPQKTWEVNRNAAPIRDLLGNKKPRILSPEARGEILPPEKTW